MFDKFFDLYITYIIPSTALMPLLVGLFHFKKLSQASKVMWSFVLFSALLNLSNNILMNFVHNTQFMLHAYTAVEFAMLSAYFTWLLPPSYKKPLTVIAIIFFVGCIVNALYIQDIGAFNTYTRTIESLILIIYIICFQYQQSNKLTTNKWGDDSNNWLSVGVLTYYASSSLMFAFTNYLVQISVHVFNLVWTAHCTILAVEYVLFTIGFLKDAQQKNIALNLAESK